MPVRYAPTPCSVRNGLPIPVEIADSSPGGLRYAPTPRYSLRSLRDQARRVDLCGASRRTSYPHRDADWCVKTHSTATDPTIGVSAISKSFNAQPQAPATRTVPTPGVAGACGWALNKVSILKGCQSQSRAEPSASGILSGCDSRRASASGGLRYAPTPRLLSAITS